MFRSIFVLLLFQYSLIFAQVSTRLVSEKSEIHYAEKSPTGKFLVLSQQHDTIRVLEASTLKPLYHIPFKSAQNGMDGNSFGRKDFMVLPDDQLAAVTREIKKDSALLYLQIFELLTGKPLKKIFITSYYHGINPVFDLMPDYRMSGSGETMLLTIRGKVFRFDAGSDKLQLLEFLKETKDAAYSPNQKQIAVISEDSLKIFNSANLQFKTGKKFKADGIVFLDGSTLALLSEHALIINLNSLTIIDTIYHSFGTITGIVRGPENQFSISGSGTSGPLFNGSFTTVYQSNFKALTGIFHLPRTSGVTSFFSSKSELWCTTADGRLFKFSVVADTIPKTISQRGHKVNPNFFSFSSDGRAMVSTESGGDLIVWDVPSGRVTERYKTNQHGLSAAYFAPGSQDILFNTTGDYRRIHRAVASNSDRGLQFNVFLDPKSVGDAAELEFNSKRNADIIRELKEKHRVLENGAAARTASFFAGIVKEDSDYMIKLVNLKTGESDLIPIPDNIRMQYDSDPFAFYDDQTLVMNGAQNTIIFYHIPSGKISRRFGQRYEDLGQMFNGIQKIFFSAQGDSLFAVMDQRIIKGWNLRTGESFLKLGNYMKGVNQEQGADYQRKTMTMFHQASNTTFAVVIDSKKSFLTMIVAADTSFRQSTDQYQLIAHKAAGYPVKMSLSPDATRLLVLREHALNNGKTGHFIDLWDLANYNLISSTAVPDLTYTAWSVSWKDRMVAIWDVNATATSEQKKMREFAGNQFTMGGMNTYPRIKILNLENQKIQEIDLDKLKVINRVENIVFIGNKEIWLRDGYHGRLHRLNIVSNKITGEIHRQSDPSFGSVGKFLVSTGSDIYYSLTPDSFSPVTEIVRYSINENRIAAQGSTGGPEIMSISEPHPSGVIAIGYTDLSISVRDALTLKEKFKIVQNEEGNYLFLTGDNYYMADRQSAQALSFNWQNKSVTMNQFDAWFNRPDQVLRSMGFLEEDEYKLLETAVTKRQKSAGLKKISANWSASLPEILIENISELPMQTSLEKIILKFRGKSNTDEIVSWKILVNGVPVPGAAGKQIKPSSSFSEMAELPLTIGENRIQVRCSTVSGVESLPDEFVITRTGVQKKPDLYLITIAINTYQNEAYNLKYAVKDARDVMRFFRTSREYANIFGDSLFNERVNETNIKSLKQKLKLAKPDDQIIIFLAGHGVLDENFDFRFAAWNVDMNRPSETGILYSVLDDLMDGLACRNKIMLIDACHSGQVDKNEIQSKAEEIVIQRGAQDRITRKSFNAVQQYVFKSGMIDRKGFELMQELFYGLGSTTGSQVVVATAGDSYAQESAEWNNGVFTYSMLSGLKSGEADLNKNKVITTDELVSYLKDRVKLLTKGNQVPRFREENIDNHFPVWSIK